MTTRSNSPADKRRSERKRATFTASVIDMITGQPMGQVGNLSAGGLMLISTQAPQSDALYQVSISLPSESRLLTESQPIALGLQEEWHEPARNPGQVWAGFRIVAITDTDLVRLEAWLKDG